MPVKKYVKKTVWDLQDIAAKRGGRCLSSTYTTITEKYEWECSSGHVWQASANSVLRMRSWCPNCAGLARLSLEALHRAASSRGGSCSSSEYVNTKTKYWWKCAIGHEWQATFNGVMYDLTWCRECSKNNTKAQLEVFELCKGLCSDSQLNASGILRSPLLEFDVWVPSLRKAVELDGEHWHSSPDAKERDARKDSECKEAGIQLLRIGYKKHWFRKKRPIGEALIKDFLKEDNLQDETKSLTTE
jgi:very-short-patch-repair endonuclease